MGRRGRRCKQLLGDFKENIVCSKLREEALRLHCEELALEEAVDLFIQWMNTCPTYTCSMALATKSPI